RKDLESGAVALVVEAGLAQAFGPSISASGRYVSFTTTRSLDPLNDPAPPQDSDVYVADMATPPSPSYEIASARNGCDLAQGPGQPCGLVYAGGNGSSAAGRVALSADGRRVAFVVQSQSNLGGAIGDVPANQVVVRDLGAAETILVSAERDPVTGGMMPSP